MTRIAIITFYDMICYGTRLISAIAEEEGIESHLILVKDEKSHIPIWKDRDEFSTYQYFFNGLKRGSLYAVDPVTEREKHLLIEQLRQIQPDLICLSTRSFALDISKDIFARIRHSLPGVPILSGGWGPTLEPEKFLEFSDFVFFGEGERSFRTICNMLRAKSDLSSALREVDNMIYFEDGQMVRNPVAKPLTSDEMNTLVFPDFSREHKYLITNNRVRLGRDFYNNKIYDCFAGRGCPMNCSYCMSSKYEQLYKDHYQVFCPKYRMRSVNRVIEELRKGKRNGAEIIRIKDEVFPTNRIWVEEFINRYKAEIDLPFFGYIRPEFHSPETIKKLIEAGLYVTILGIQSGSEEIRKTVYFRNLPKAKVIEFAKLLKQAELDFLYHFIYRNPFEKEEHLKETLDFIYELPYAPICIYKLEKFPGSPISRMIEQNKPSGADKTLNLWYANLFTLASKSPLHRKLCKAIYKYRVLRRHPMWLTLIFLPELLKEVKTYIISSLKYGAKARLLPSRKFATRRNARAVASS